MAVRRASAAQWERSACLSDAAQSRRARSERRILRLYATTGLRPGRKTPAIYQRGADAPSGQQCRSEEHTSELQSRQYLVCRLLLEKKNQRVRFTSSLRYL